MLAEIVWDSEMIFLVMIFAIPIVAIVGGLWHKTERTKAEASLKRSMVERGMSAEEIERVISAKSK